MSAAEREDKGPGAGPASSSGTGLKLSDVSFVQYTDEETQMAPLMGLIDKELSEPYSIFTYRYFINNWPNLCILAHLGEQCIGVVICKVCARARARARARVRARESIHTRGSQSAFLFQRPVRVSFVFFSWSLLLLFILTHFLRPCFRSSFPVHT